MTKANPDSVFGLGARTATKVNSYHPSQQLVDEVIQNPQHRYWVMVEEIFGPKPQQPDPAQAQIIKIPPTITNQWRDGVIKLYKDFMQMDIQAELDKFEWLMDRCRTDFNWFIFRPQGLTTQIALDKLCKPQFTVQEYIDVSKYSLERQPDQSHLVLCRETIEPDEEWLNHSSDDMSTTSTPFLDICDRIVLEATYFLVFKKHLDIKGFTRCPRSRSGRRVADAAWRPNDSKFRVFDSLPDNRNPDNGGREAIVLERTLKSS